MYKKFLLSTLFLLIPNMMLGKNYMMNCISPDFKKTAFYQITTLVPLRYYFKILLADNHKKDIQAFSSSKKVINLISEICLNKCKAYISIIPSSNYWDPHINFKNYKKQLRELSSQKGIVFFDGEEVIDNNKKENYLLIL